MNTQSRRTMTIPIKHMVRVDGRNFTEPSFFVASNGDVDVAGNFKGWIDSPRPGSSLRLHGAIASPASPVADVRYLFSAGLTDIYEKLAGDFSAEEQELFDLWDPGSHFPEVWGASALGEEPATPLELPAKERDGEKQT